MQTQQEASDDHMVEKSSFEIIHSLISEAEHKYVYNRKRETRDEKGKTNTVRIVMNAIAIQFDRANEKSK